MKGQLMNKPISAKAIDQERELRDTRNYIRGFLSIMLLLLVQAGIVWTIVMTGGLPEGAVNDPRTLLLFAPITAYATLVLPWFVLPRRAALIAVSIFAIFIALTWPALQAFWWLYHLFTS